MNTKIYFDGQEAYFDKEEIITGTYALNKVGDLKSRQGINTNTYSLPFVKQNKAIFKDCELIQNDGDGPYIAYVHEVVIEGISVFKGTAFVNESWGSYKVQAVAGNSDFYLLLNNKSLSDLDYSDLDHIRNDANMIASWANTEGYIYPFIDYGKYQNVTNSSLGSDDSPNIVSPTDIYPAIFYKTIIQKISDYTGYIFQGNVFQNQRFLDEFVPFTNFPFTQQDNGGHFEGSLRMTFPPSVLATDMMAVLTEIEDPDSLYDAYGFYTNNFSKFIKISVAFQSTISSGYFVVKRPSYNTSNDFHRQSGDDYVLNSGDPGQIEKTIFVSPGDRIFMWVRSTSSGSANLFQITSFIIDTVEIDNGYGLEWIFSKNVPGIKLNKFILDFMNSYGLSIKTDNELKVINFISDDDLLLNEPVDWTGKIDYSNKNESDQPQIDYRLDKYTQSNLLTYKTDTWLPDGFDYTFTIDDAKLSSEIYTDFISEFSLAPLGAAFLGGVQTINVNMFTLKPPLLFKGLFVSGAYLFDDVVFYQNGLFKAIVDNPIGFPSEINPIYPYEPQWAIVNNTDVWEIKKGMPLISRIDRRNTGPTVDFQDEAMQEIKVFAINTDMDWPTIWENHYQLLKRLLVKTKIVQLPLLLNYADISNLDLTRPVWFKEFGLYFKVDEVLQFKFNQVDSTLVRLIRI